MQFQNLNDDDWRLFLQWAVAEGWTVPFQEQCLFQNQWRPYFFVLRAEGQVQGFVSAVAYKQSGWIGNLLVGPDQRGRGYGFALFDFALDFLGQSALKRVWLTASKDGMPLYQRRGFASIDRIERWRGEGLGTLELEKQPLLAELMELDRSCWGDSRAPLLAVLADDGEICRSGGALGLLQPGLASWQFGPWLAPNKCSRVNRLLVTQALGKTPAGRPLLIDQLVSAETGLLLRSAGFDLIGSNELMCLGDAPALAGVVALASLGSVG